MRDRLLFYPRLPGQGTRGGGAPTDGAPIEVAGSVQAADLTGTPIREIQENGRRHGRLSTSILLADAPPVAVANGWRVEHVGTYAAPGRPAVTFAAPDVYRACGAAIPPAAGRSRWTVCVERDD
jgi:hypothetical protein